MVSLCKFRPRVCSCIIILRPFLRHTFLMVFHIAMEFLACKMLVIILHTQYALDSLYIQNASLFCLLNCISEKSRSAFSLCEGIAKKTGIF
jgi:hypothetical protein